MKTLEFENHLTWIHQPWIRKGDSKFVGYPNIPNMKSFVQALLVTSPPQELAIDSDYLEQDQDFEEGQGGGSLQKRKVSFASIAHKLNLAAMYAYVEDYEAARKHVKATLAQLDGDFQKKITGEQLLAVVYAFESLEWSIEKLYRWRTTQPTNDITDLLAPETEEDRQNWSKFSNDWRLVLKTNESQAVIVFFKGCLTRALKMPSTEVMELFESSRVMDPSCYLWHFYIFCFTRNERKLTGGFLVKPGELERAACAKAIELAPDDYDCNMAKAMVILDDLWMEDEKCWEYRECAVIACINLLKKAADIAKQSGHRMALCQAKMYLGGLLLYGKCKTLLNQSKGKEILKRCEKDCPRSAVSNVSLKIAQMYQFGASTGEFQSDEKAEVYYQRAHRLDPGNFPNLIVYLKFLKTKASSLRPFARTRLYLAMETAILESLKVIKAQPQRSRLEHLLVTLKILEESWFAMDISLDSKPGWYWKSI